MLRRHWPFALVLTAGAALRVACEIAYRPALFYPDSWGYLATAHGPGIVGFAPLRPSGYPIVLKVLSVVGDGLLATTLVQHLAGLATGAVVYALLAHYGVRRPLATVGGAVVVLDAWAIALEQYVLSEALFGLLVALAVASSLVGTKRAAGSGAALAFAGLALAAASLMRPVGLFAVPAWLIWMAWARVGARAALAGIVALALPLLVYSGVHASKTGTFGLTQADGWFLYGRVGPIASCNGIDVDRAARALCRQPPGAADERQSFFMFARESPARQAFGGISADHDKQARTNRILRHFAIQVIEHRPGAYLKLVGGDFLRFMRPGPHALYREDRTVEFPERARIAFDDPRIRRRLFPGVRPHASAPSGALRSYARVVHTSRPLIALVTLLSLVALGVGARRRDPRAQAVFLALATGVFVLLGSAATAAFALRYLVPLVAEFAIAATLSVELLTRAAGEGRRAAHGGLARP
ncbi:MAG: hypothetical protein ACJ76Z_02585 [Thermoleophilaceae bacterium]